jgi:mono/diheme cytochrome c family protein
MLIGGTAFILLCVSGAWVWWSRFDQTLASDPNSLDQVVAGRIVYEGNCASCHGDHLQGELNWQQRKPSGRMPAPPHDASGHTWHHPDSQLFAFVKNGITPYAPAGYQSDMQAFGGKLTDEQIAAVLAYIKSSWPEEIRERQKKLSRAQP